MVIYTLINITYINEDYTTVLLGSILTIEHTTAI